MSTNRDPSVGLSGGNGQHLETTPSSVSASPLSCHPTAPEDTGPASDSDDDGQGVIGEWQQAVLSSDEDDDPSAHLTTFKRLPPNWFQYTPLQYDDGITPMPTDAELIVAFRKQARDWPVIPEEEVPLGWTNDWEQYFISEVRSEWVIYDNYGGIRWTFNEVLQIPGEPKLLLVSLRDEIGEAFELIEIAGMLVLYDRLWEHEYYATDMDLEHTLQACVEEDYPCRRQLRQVKNAIDVYDTWRQGLRYAQERREASGAGRAKEPAGTAFRA